MGLTSHDAKALPGAHVVQAVRQTRQSVGLARLNNNAVLRISGPDAQKFLHNRLTSDVQALQSGQGQPSACVDRQGKIEGVFSLHRQDDDFWILIDQAERERTVQGIEKFHIVENFQLADVSEQYTLWAIQGPLAEEALCAAGIQGNPAETGKTLEEYAMTSLRAPEGGRLIRRALFGEEGYLLLLPASALVETWLERLRDAIRQREGCTDLPPEALEILRVEAGWPRYGQDYQSDTLLPETGLERETVSYTKGCYLGQETIARIKTYGTLQRVLMGIRFDTAPSAVPAPGTPCLLAGKPVGQVQSVVFSPTLDAFVGLAYLGRSERVPGKQLTLQIGDWTGTVTVSLLPLVDVRQAHRSAQDWLDDGLQRFADGLDEAAMHALREAIARDKTLIDAYEALGVILARNERHLEAIEMMQAILALDPDHVLAHTNLSMSYMKLGDKEKAEEEKAKATMAAFNRKAREAGLAPVDPDAARRQHEQALRERIAMFEEALKFNPADPLGNFGLGSAHLELGQYAQAITPLERTITAQPKHSVAYLSLGKALEGDKQLARAREVYDQGIAVAAAKGDLMPLQEMQARRSALD